MSAVGAFTLRFCPRKRELVPETTEKETTTLDVPIAKKGCCIHKRRIQSLNDIFGLKIFAPDYRPTNGEFIALIADRLTTVQLLKTN